MKRTVRLREEADRHVNSAATWYLKQRAGLGHDFLDEVLSTFRSIADRPLIYPVIYRNTRRALLQRFPFAVYFRIDGRAIVVMAVLHGSRHPRRWQSRK
jgi:plasmid stabilization system protein ParE